MLGPETIRIGQHASGAAGDPDANQVMQWQERLEGRILPGVVEARPLNALCVAQVGVYCQLPVEKANRPAQRQPNAQVNIFTCGDAPGFPELLVPAE